MRIFVPGRASQNAWTEVIVPDYTFADIPTLMTRMTGDEKHEASATSTLDVIWVLYDRVIHVDPLNSSGETFHRRN